jgi:pyruvate, water dikinase
MLDVVATRPATSCLSAVEVRQVARMAKLVEQHYGCPQDIEWAVSQTAPARENVFLLQSRPETVWAEKDAARKATAAAPAARAFDHVFNVLGKRPGG